MMYNHLTKCFFSPLFSSTQDTERKAIDPNNSTNVSLEKFMAKLCSHHQKQFILVLNNLCTEESILKSKSRSASVSQIENANIEDYDHSYSLVEINESVSESCLNGQVYINNPTDLHEDNFHHGLSHCSDYLSKVPISPDPKEDHAINVSHTTAQTITNNPAGLPTTEEKTGPIFTKISESQIVFLEHCVLSRSNSVLNMSNDSPGSELTTNIPKIADKENAQYINTKQTLLDCSDCKVKQENSVTTVTVKKLGNFCESPLQNFTDYSGSALQKVRLHDKRLKTVKCKNSRVLMTNDCDQQCDVVYISEPITTECHFENQKSVVCHRNTARKSTRGYLLSGDCCELSTVRTLVRSSKVEDKGNSALHMAEALIIPNGLIETLPTADVESLIHIEEKRVETHSFNQIPPNDDMSERMPVSSKSVETENHCNQSLGMANEPVDNACDSLIAVFSITQDEPEKAHGPSNHTANELALNEHADNIPKIKLNSSVVNTDAHSLSVNDHEKSIAKLGIDPDFSVSHSSNSCGQEDHFGTQSLDMEVIVSFKNNHVFSEHTTSECLPHNIAMEEASATLPSTAYSSSLPNETADQDLPSIGSYSLNNITILPQASYEAVIADSPVTSAQQLLMQMCSKTNSGVLCKENSDSQIAKTPLADLGSSSSEIKLHEPSVAKENEHFIDLKIFENVKDGHSLGPNDCVEMEIHENSVQENIDSLQPVLGELNCPTPAEHFHSPLNTCAKLVDNVKLEANVSKEDPNNCDTVSLSGCNKKYTCEEPLETKEANEESNLGAVNLDTIDSSLIINNPIKHITPSKKHKKVPAPTDRCLRSCETHGDSLLQKVPSLQVLLSYVKDTDTAQRSVELKTENTPCATTFPVSSSVDETTENYFAVSLNSHCREGNPLHFESAFKSTCSSPFKMSENLKICFKIGSGKRLVSLVKDNPHNCLNMVDAECKCGSKSLSNVCELQLQKYDKRQSENVSNSISRTRSSTKHVAVKSLKDKMKYFKSGRLKNQSTEDEQKNGSNKQVNRSKFIDWCSEEENQERISNFNNKYTTVHKNWIPLERETANVAKSKNKADKLKEIWKTKKRIRRPKSVQDASRCSPMQMLFMNSFKFSDICGWFMETTETKSLVIVKKLNTRFPEEHQLPMIPSPKYSEQSLYPHMLQAQRLKKHLKKFASVFPARNDIKTQNSLNTLISSVPLNQVPKDTVNEPNDCKKQELNVKAKKASVHILQKCNSLHENVKYQSCTENKNKGCTTKSKVGHAENPKGMSNSELRLQEVSNSLTTKSLVLNKKSKKRSKSDSLIESITQPNKKRKIKAQQEFLKNGPNLNKNAVSTKTKVRKLSKINLTSSSQAPKKQVGKAEVYKTSLRKGKAKTPMQKQSLKSQLGHRRQTRSAKWSQVPPNLVDSSKITSLSSSHRKKELHKKICAVSLKKKNVASQVRHCKQRSQLEPPTRKGRSLEFK